MNNKNLAVLFIVGIAVVAGLIFFLPQKQEEVAPVVETVPSVESATDLNRVESDLDSTDLDQVDSELDQIDTYSSEF
jgi:hypothetical protein